MVTTTTSRRASRQRWGLALLSLSLAALLAGAQDDHQHMASEEHLHGGFRPCARPEAPGPAPLPPTAAACPPPARRPAEREVLLQFKDGITNWAAVQASWQLKGWTPCTPANCLPVCSWGGIE